MIIKIAHNVVMARLIDAPKEVKLRVSTLLSYRVQGVENMASFKTSTWDGRSSFFDFKKGMFPAGFVNLVQTTLTREGLTVQLARKPLPAPLGPENPKVDAFDPDPRYDYQEQTVKRLLKHGQMIARVATGGGKSRIAKLVYATINRNTLFLTTRSVLMYQMADAFKKDMGINVGIIGDGHWAPRKGMNVAMVQSIAPYTEKKTIDGEIERLVVNKHNADTKAIDELKAQLKKKKANFVEINNAVAELRKELAKKDLTNEEMAAKVTKTVNEHNAKVDQVTKLLSFFEVVIAEEAHESSGNGFYNAMKMCVNAHYRLALTATPFMKDDEEANMRLMACCGPVGITVSEEMLIERGILARPYFKIINMPEPLGAKTPNYSKLRKSTPWQRAYKLGIVDNEVRNYFIVRECVRAAKYKLGGMVLVQQTAHGHALKQELEKKGIKALFIYGKHEQDQRKDALQKLAKGEIDILIGSTILDVGVDVPAVGLVVLAGGGKAEVALRQRIGRGLRAKKGANVCFILDFADDRNSHLKEHALQRRSIIENTPGFAENILPANQDFDYDELLTA